MKWLGLLLLCAGCEFEGSQVNSVSIRRRPPRPPPPQQQVIVPVLFWANPTYTNIYVTNIYQVVPQP